MESRTLAQLRAEVAYLSDTESLTARHPTADVNRRINAAIRAYRARVTSNGLPYFIEQTDPATLAGTQVTGEQYSEVPYPEDADQIVGVDVSSGVDRDDWYELQPVTWASRRRVARTPESRGPGWFALKRLPSADPDDLDAIRPGAIAIFPGQDSGAYSISYLPSPVDLAADADLFVALPEGIQWVVQTVVMELSQRDDDVRETYQIAANRRAEADAAILAAASRVQSAGPLLPRRRGRYDARRFR